MSLLLIVAPAAEPLSVEDARAFLKLDATEDDALLQALIVAARMHVEAATRRFLVTQTWRCGFGVIPRGGVLSLPVAPVQAVAAVRLVERPGDPVGLATADWTADLAASPPRVRLGGRPARLGGVEVDAVAGFGPPAAVPPALCQAIRVLVASWYEDRAFIGTGMPPLTLPPAVVALLAPWRTKALT
jgi:uncharacterized phiE125 gp8 family phage protein